MLWDGFWGLFLGLKTLLESLRFSLGMVTEFTSLPHTWRLVSIGIVSLRYTRGTGRRSTAQKPVIILLLWILFRATPVKNVWPQCSQSACSHVSAVLFYAQTAKFVWAQICVGDTRVSRLQAKGQQISFQSKHWSGNCRVCQTCSISPVGEKWMHKWNSTVKIIEGSKFKFQKLTENVGRPRPSQPCPCFRRPWISSLHKAGFVKYK